MQRVEVLSIRAPLLDWRDARTLLLKTTETDTYFWIGIGKHEADVIYWTLRSVEWPRPLTHELVRNAIEAREGVIQRVVVRRVTDDAYYAEVVVRDARGTTNIDARPSDAIAIALQSDVPIYASAQVIRKAGFTTKPATGQVVRLTDGSLELQTDGSNRVQLAASLCARIDLMPGDRVVGGVRNLPGTESGLSLALVESVNGKRPTRTYDLTPYNVPISIVTPDEWLLSHFGNKHYGCNFSPSGTEPGALGMSARMHECGDLDSAGFLEQILDESEGGFELLDDGDDFTLPQGFDVAALTRTTRQLWFPIGHDGLLEGFLSLEGVTTRWLIGVSGTHALVVLLEALDWNQVCDVEPLLGEIEARPGGVTAHLSGRETEVLELIATGATNAEIAESLGISPNTVAHHVKSILAKTKATNRAAAVSYGVTRGVIDAAPLN